LCKNDSYSIDDYLPVKFLSRNKESILMLTNKGSYCSFIESVKSNNGLDWSESVCLDYLFKLRKNENQFSFF
jgi:hypothetical protein